jgi:peptidoglycan/LPS O-acetylase OafA/YrhL
VTAVEARPPFVSVAPKLGLVGGFDGIRGIGVCMVLVGHALSEYLESWVTIVDTFFVLSGFLITTLLLQEARSTGTISLRKFYLRRATRLLPSVWLFAGVWLLISGFATAVGFEPLNIRHVGADALAAVTYVYHLFFPNGLYVIEPDVQSNRVMWHLWTLSVEEWFYLVIAGTVLVCVRRRWVLQLGVLMVGTFAAIAVARWFAFTGFFQDDDSMVPGVRMAFLQRPDALALGVAIACGNAYVTGDRAERLRRPMLWVSTAALGIWLLMLNLSSGLVDRLGGPHLEYLPSGPEQFSRPQMLDTLYWFRFGHSVGALAFGCILVALVHYRDWWLARLWSWHGFQWMGRLSYTLYVWHALPYLLLMAVLGGAEASFAVQVARLPLLVLAAFAVSIPVYYLLELRVLRMKLRFSTESEVLDLRTGKMMSLEDALAAGKSNAANPARDGSRQAEPSNGPPDGAAAGEARERAPGDPGAPQS